MVFGARITQKLVDTSPFEVQYLGVIVLATERLNALVGKESLNVVAVAVVRSQKNKYLEGSSALERK